MLFITNRAGFFHGRRSLLRPNQIRSLVLIKEQPVAATTGSRTSIECCDSRGRFQGLPHNHHGHHHHHHHHNSPSQPPPPPATLLFSFFLRVTGSGLIRPSTAHAVLLILSLSKSPGRPKPAGMMTVFTVDTPLPARMALLVVSHLGHIATVRAKSLGQTVTQLGV
ncbi:hypothetical protein ElyMa_004591800 [Elysia marginata]|uniref:Uncharacterized protein n=1 Tax=Elysia marginata TaxID=1093978 RepID=A0AAV4HX87_9GAST|nr:hypothetical protein ElyMa_004591800 [Elysia marginata]